MKKIKKYLRSHSKVITFGILIVVGLALLFTYKLGSLIGGLSGTEQQAANTAYGLEHFFNSILYAPLDFVRGVTFFVFPSHGQTLTRLPNSLFGILAVISFALLVRIWHGNRTALLATLLFACSAWTLHVSRFASYEVLYLWAMPTLLLGNALLNQKPTKGLYFYGTIILWGILLTIPGMIWFIAFNLFWQRKLIAEGWRHFSKWWQRSLYVLAGVVWLPLLAKSLDSTKSLLLWLGIPQDSETPLIIVRNIVAVPYHFLLRGPVDSQLWLGRAPILDVFCIAMCLVGLYFYFLNRSAKRSRVLLSFLVIAVVLAGLHGPVGLSVVLPLLYLFVATGLAFLIREWLKVFPLNPIARSIGVALVVILVLFSCLYNIRAYFIAWPHNTTAVTTFRYHR